MTKYQVVYGQYLFKKKLTLKKDQWHSNLSLIKETANHWRKKRNFQNTCYNKSKLSYGLKLWTHIEHEKDIVYIYCWNHTIMFMNISQVCENAVYKLLKNGSFFLDSVQFSKLSLIEIKNFTSLLINSKINLLIFPALSGNIEDLEGSALRSKENRNFNDFDVSS